VAAVVSGRPASFLAEHLGRAETAAMHGLYGLERLADGVAVARAGAEEWRDRISEASDRAQSSLPEGSAVERKGLTVTLHYRAIPDRAGEVEGIGRRIAEALGLAAHPGKMSIELRPPVTVDKGTVIRELSRGLTNIAFAGDDNGDLPAFAALADMREKGRHTLAIAADGPETPAAVIAAADMRVDGPGGVIEILRTLAEG
jgi:trehalose 6-phosphate phosphatase